MRSILIFLFSFLSFGLFSQTVFWSEDFGTGCNQGQTAATYVSPNGSWVTTNTGFNEVSSNLWYVSATENGEGEGNCGAGCGNNRTLHLGNQLVSGISADIGAAYYEGLTGFCGFFPCGSTSKRIDSPVIDCTAQSDVQLSFVYIEGGNTIDNATLWYYDGSTWSQLADMAKTLSGACSPQGLWTAFNISLPASADNNPNVQIGFEWINNDDGNATDPSFAVDDIELSGIEDTGNPVAVCQDITVSLDESGSYSLSANEIDGGSTDDIGIASLVLDQTEFTCADIGENQVSLTVTDTDGNTDSCTAAVTVVDDLDPEALCQDISIQLDEDGNASLTPDQVDGGSNDNCGIQNLEINPNTFTEADLGNNAVVLTVTDESGNSSTCAAIVTVEEFSLPCPFDLNGDGLINTGDLTALLGEFGQQSDFGDFNGDGIVNTGDLTAFLGAFGTDCP